MYEQIKTLCNALTATSQYFKQTHLCAALGGHAIHELTQQTYEHLDDNTDRLKELAIIIFGDRRIAIAANSLSEAATFCKNIPNNAQTDDIQLMVKNCLSLLDELGEMCENLCATVEVENKPFMQGLLNALGDISETLARDKYLLAMEIK